MCCWVISLTQHCYSYHSIITHVTPLFELKIKNILILLTWHCFFFSPSSFFQPIPLFSNFIAYWIALFIECWQFLVKQTSVKFLHCMIIIISPCSILSRLVWIVALLYYWYYKRTTYGATQKWLSWTGGCLIKQLC